MRTQSTVQGEATARNTTTDGGLLVMKITEVAVQTRTDMTRSPPDDATQAESFGATGALAYFSILHCFSRNF